MKMSSADKDWSLAVKINAGHRCEYCFGTRSLNSHHFFGRRYRATRHDVSNGFCLCADHHINLAHQRPAEFTEWAKRKRGESWYYGILSKSRKIKYDNSLDVLICRQIVKQSN